MKQKKKTKICDFFVYFFYYEKNNGFGFINFKINGINIVECRI